MDHLPEIPTAAQLREVAIAQDRRITELERIVKELGEKVNRVKHLAKRS